MSDREMQRQVLNEAVRAIRRRLRHATWACAQDTGARASRVVAALGDAAARAEDEKRAGCVILIALDVLDRLAPLRLTRFEECTLLGGGFTGGMREDIAQGLTAIREEVPRERS